MAPSLGSEPSRMILEIVDSGTPHFLAKSFCVILLWRSQRVSLSPVVSSMDGYLCI